jgi:ATPase family associated with various cellular activities (AAA)
VSCFCTAEPPAVAEKRPEEVRIGCVVQAMAGLDGVALTHRGHAAAFVDEDAVVVVRLDRPDRVVISAAHVSAFAFFGDELWVVSNDVTRRFALDGTSLGTAAKTPMIAWASRWQDERRITLCADRTDVDVGKERVQFACALPPHTRPVSAAPILGGRAIAIWARDAAGCLLSVHDRTGSRVRIVRVSGDGPVAFAEDAGLAVVASGRELVTIDLRLGETRTTLLAPFDVDAVAIDANGTTLVVAGIPEGESRRAVMLIEPSQAKIKPARAPAPAIEPAEETPVEPVTAEPLDAPPIEWTAEVAPEPAPADHRDAWIVDALEQAVCHAAMLYERLVFAGRANGLLPSSSGGDDDPLGALCVSDGDVTSMLATFRRIATDHERRPIPDPYAAAILASREKLMLALARADRCGLGLARLVRTFELAGGVLDAWLLALAPDLDLRFGRIAGYLNNDTTRCRPTFGHLVMAAQLGRAGIDLRVAAELERALVRTGLIERGADPHAPLANQAVLVPSHIIDLVATDVSAELASVAWDDLAWTPADRARIRGAVTRELARSRGQRLIVLAGAPGSGRATIARGAAAELGMPLHFIELELESEPESHANATLLRAVFRARLAGAALAVRGKAPLGLLHATARDLGVPCFVIGGDQDVDVPFVRFEAPPIDPGARRCLWEKAFAVHDLATASSTLDDLATRYQLTPGRLIETAAEIATRTRQVTVEAVRETLSSITGTRLAHLARRNHSRIRLDDLAFPASVSLRIRELIHRVELRRRVLSEWAFADKAHDGYGVSALFVGPPGTGKTAGAIAIANALHVDLYVVDLSRIMSKWVGETEQNLARVFDEAEASNVALLFDEADALFGKRSVEQKSASDRYANLTINYLLQRMEAYGGLAMLTTNLMSAMDPAFQRRITSIVQFPPSDHAMRVQLWRKLLPTGARFADDVDLPRLARTHEMEAAHIRRALTRAAFRAASTGRSDAVLSDRDLAWAAAAEYEDMGRISHRVDDRAHTGGN